jgi:hypothetical protein
MINIKYLHEAGWYNLENGFHGYIGKYCMPSKPPKYRLGFLRSSNKPGLVILK